MHRRTKLHLSYSGKLGGRSYEFNSAQSTLSTRKFSQPSLRLILFVNPFPQYINKALSTIRIPDIHSSAHLIPRKPQSSFLDLSTARTRLKLLAVTINLATLNPTQTNLHPFQFTYASPQKLECQQGALQTYHSTTVPASNSLLSSAKPPHWSITPPWYAVPALSQVSKAVTPTGFPGSP